MKRVAARRTAEIEAGEAAVGLQREADGFGSLGADLVVCQTARAWAESPQPAQYRVSHASRIAPPKPHPVSYIYRLSRSPGLAIRSPGFLV